MRAAESEQLDGEFLEYLAEFANAEDDWTWFASDDDAEKAAKPAAKPVQKPAEKVKP